MLLAAGAGPSAPHLSNRMMHSLDSAASNGRLISERSVPSGLGAITLGEHIHS